MYATLNSRTQKRARTLPSFQSTNIHQTRDSRACLHSIDFSNSCLFVSIRGSSLPAVPMSPRHPACGIAVSLPPKCRLSRPNPLHSPFSRRNYLHSRFSRLKFFSPTLPPVFPPLTNSLPPKCRLFPRKYLISSFFIVDFQKLVRDHSSATPGPFKASKTDYPSDGQITLLNFSTDSKDPKQLTQKLQKTWISKMTDNRTAVGNSALSTQHFPTITTPFATSRSAATL